MTSDKIGIWTAGSCNTTSKRKAGGWAYLIKYENKEFGRLEIMHSGNSWGTTEGQMELMAVLSAITTTNDLDRLTDAVVVYPYNIRIAQCLRGTFDCKNRRVLGDYLREIEWATGSLVIKYIPTVQLASRVYDLAVQERQKLER